MRELFPIAQSETVAPSPHPHGLATLYRCHRALTGSQPQRGITAPARRHRVVSPRSVTVLAKSPRWGAR